MKLQEDEYRGLPLQGLIGAPAIALASANNMMAMEQVRFLLDFCFGKLPNGTYEPVLVQMILTKAYLKPSNRPLQSPDSLEKVTSLFEVPLVTLVPFNSLAMDEAEVAMTIFVTHYKFKDEGVIPGLRTGYDEPNQTYYPVNIMGNISHDNSEASVRDTEGSPSVNYSPLYIRIHTEQIDLPIGLKSIIQMYGKAIFPIDIVDDEDPQENIPSQEGFGESGTLPAQEPPQDPPQSLRTRRLSRSSARNTSSGSSSRDSWGRPV